MAGPLGRLHLVTDVRRDRDPVAVVRAALSAGVPVVQVRVPDHVSDLGAYHLSKIIADLCREAGATCLINDRLHIALAVGADGGHVGGDDLPVAAARRVLGPHAILGATARDPAAARAAAAAGATYLGVGPAFATRTKDGLPDPLGAAGIRAVAEAVTVPVIAIGAVTADRVPELLAAGAYGVAVVTAVSDAPDPGAAAAELLAALPVAEPAVSQVGRGGAWTDERRLAEPAQVLAHEERSDEGRRRLTAPHTNPKADT